MGYTLPLILCMVPAYLAGSVNFAILISRWARGIDIRSAGNRNPGTANVGREVGRGWAALVFLGDMGKGVVVLMVARSFFFPGEGWKETLALVLTGMAAITGHCWPVYHGFRGGGGLATSIGIYMFLIPVEFFFTLVTGTVAVRLLFRGKKYPFGQLVPMVFVPLAPLVTLVTSFFSVIGPGGRPWIGGHSWHLVGGITLLSLYIIVINIRIVLGRFSKN